MKIEIDVKDLQEVFVVSLNRFDEGYCKAYKVSDSLFVVDGKSIQSPLPYYPDEETAKGHLKSEISCKLRELNELIDNNSVNWENCKDKYLADSREFHRLEVEFTAEKAKLMEKLK